MSLLSNINIQINQKPLKSFQYVTINQNLYGIDSFTITCRYDAAEKLDGFLIEKTKDFLGLPIVIQTKIKVKDEEKDGISFQGFVTEIQSTRSGMADYDQIIISGGSSEIIMNRKPTNRAFIDKTLEEVVKEVLKSYQIKTKLSVRNKFRFPYIVQFEESDFEFLKRLSIRYGEWFFFNGKELVFGEIPEMEGNLTIGYNLQDFRYELKVKPVRFSISSVDPLKSDVYNYQSGNSKIESNLNIYGKHALKMSKKLYSEEGNDYYGYLNVNESEYKKGIESVGETEEAADAINLADLSGNSTNGFLTSGMFIKINCPKEDSKDKMSYGKYLLTSIQHNMDNTLAYQNSFTAIPAETAIPENTDINFVKFTNNQLGLISDNRDPKKLGRVKVSFWWMEDKQATPWLKVVTPYIQKDSGFYFVPAKNSRVLVGFEGGDVEKPYCLGTLYDEEINPDAEWAGNYEEENANVHAIRTRSGHTIEFIDEKDNEKIRIYDNDGSIIIFDTKEKSLIINATENIEISAKNINISAEENIVVGAKENIEIAAEADLNHLAKGSLAMQSDGDTTLKSKGSVTVEAASDTEISGQNLTVEGKVEAEIKGIQTTVNGKMTTVQGASGKIEVI